MKDTNTKNMPNKELVDIFEPVVRDDGVVGFYSYASYKFTPIEHQENRHP